MKIINGKEKKLGRLSSEAVKNAMKGEEVKIINAEEVKITGRKQKTIEKYRKKFNLRDPGNPEKSPKMVSRRPDLFVKKVIKGMIPTEKRKGKKAQKKIKVYTRNPKDLETKEPKEKIDTKHIKVKKLCKRLGWRDKND